MLGETLRPQQQHFLDRSLRYSCLAGGNISKGEWKIISTNGCWKSWTLPSSVNHVTVHLSWDITLGVRWRKRKKYYLFLRYILTQCVRKGTEDQNHSLTHRSFLINLHSVLEMGKCIEIWFSTSSWKKKIILSVKSGSAHYIDSNPLDLVSLPFPFPLPTARPHHSFLSSHSSPYSFDFPVQLY